jgi:hypothetical protein
MRDVSLFPQPHLCWEHKEPQGEPLSQDEFSVEQPLVCVICGKVLGHISYTREAWDAIQA